MNPESLLGRLCTVLAAAAGAIVMAGPASAEPIPIPEGPDAAALERFVGQPWQPDPIVAPDPPRHPHMAPNSRSNLHVDGYQTDVHQGPGPLGNGTTRLSTFHVADCGSVTFDTKGRIVTVCVGLQPVTLNLIDPRTLDTLAQFSLPGRPPSANPFQNFTGGGYFYLDARDRAVIPASNRHLFIVAVTDTGFEQVADFDLTAVVPEGDAIISALPDWSGLLWFASRNGVVGTIEEKSGTVRSFDTEEPNGNSFAVDSDGSVSIVTDKALYRFETAPDGTPLPFWREEYENTGQIKPGQTQAGSGTTPTLIGTDRVAITDNADPMNVLVFQRRRKARGKRLVCRQPVFEKGAGSTDQSLIATPDFIVVENNYGYTGPLATQNGNTTRPGLARIDLHSSGRGCSLRWLSQETAPSVVPKVSAATGLLYTYTKDKRPDGADAWYLTAIDLRTGTTVFKALGGEGLGHNNNYAPITLGPDGTAYIGVLGGLLAVRDAQPPVAPGLRGPGRSVVRVRCASGRRVRVVVSGGRALRVVVRRGRRQLRSDGKAPFVVTVRVRPRSRLVVRVRHEGGSTTTHRVRARRC